MSFFYLIPWTSNLLKQLLQQSLGKVISSDLSYFDSAIPLIFYTMMESKYMQNQTFWDTAVIDTLTDFLHTVLHLYAHSIMGRTYLVSIEQSLYYYTMILYCCSFIAILTNDKVKCTLILFGISANILLPPWFSMMIWFMQLLLTCVWFAVFIKNDYNLVGNDVVKTQQNWLVVKFKKGVTLDNISDRIRIFCHLSFLLHFWIQWDKRRTLHKKKKKACSEVQFLP